LNFRDAMINKSKLVMMMMMMMMMTTIMKMAMMIMIVKLMIVFMMVMIVMVILAGLLRASLRCECQASLIESGAVFGVWGLGFGV
jgi:hypothetical protein